jgi:PAS domain S-box-containing protein
MVLSHSPDPEERNHPSQGVASSTDRFLAVVHGTADFFWILTPAGEMHESGPSWQSFTGQQESDSLERGWLDAVYPADQPQVEETLHQSTLSAQPAERVCHIRRSDGVYRLVRVRVCPVCGRERSIGEFVVCGTDITSEQMNEERLHLAVEASGVGLWDLDLMTHQVVATDHAKALFGVLPTTPWTRGSLLAAVHPADRERILQLRTRALSEQRDNLYDEDFRTIWPDGSIHWLKGKARCLYDVLGQPVHLVGAVVDITELKQAEERFRRFVESNIIGISVFDREGTIHEANEAFLALVGYTQEDLSAGHVHWRALTPPEYRAQRVGALEEVLATGSAPLYEQEVVTKEGKRVPVLIGSIFFRQEGSTQVLIALVLDLTAQKESERQKDLFLGMTSHELKTPLVTLRGTLQWVQRRLARTITTTDQLSPAWSAFAQGLSKDLEDAVHHIDVQTRLINELLDISRITAHTLSLSLHPCDLVSIVRATVEDLRVTAPERVLLLEVPEQTTVNVLADRDRISQVLTNYVTNALRYASPSQPIVIGLTSQEDTARVWVRDKGPGLTEEAKTHIWQCYHQVKGVPVQSGEGEGLGLGLFICQALIAQHQGACGVESTPGVGSTFWFTLPLVSTRAHSNG